MASAADKEPKGRGEGDGLAEVIASYLDAVDAGSPPDRQQLLRDHPDLAGDLEAFLDAEASLEPLARSSITIPVAPMLAGESIGGYDLLEEIARGGMGVVFKARQRGLDRTVALKLILAGRLASPDDVERFQREARAAAGLDHPHIVPIYEVGEHQGHHFYSMKLLEGGSLAGERERFLDAPRHAARAVETIARAVHHAHLHGILHRDLKPANILLDAQGSLYVADFGLARARGTQQGTLTRSGAVVGTPEYMAPEQAAGGKRELTPAADVYSIGAILYELSTGEPPFRRDSSLETLRAVLEEEPRPLHVLDARAPRDLETICLKCLEKDPRRRYESAGELADDLQRFLAGRPVEARRTTTLERAWRWCRRNPAVASLGGLVAALLVVITLGSLVAVRQMRGKLRDAYFASARAGRTSGQAGQRFRSLRALADAARIRRSPELRDEAIRCMTLVDLELERYLNITVEGRKVTSVGLDLPRQLYAFGDDAGNVRMRRLADDSDVRTLSSSSAVKRIRFSPDGRFVAVWYGNLLRTFWLRVWDLESHVAAEPILEEKGSWLDFDAVARRAAIGRDDGSIAVYDLRERREIGSAPIRSAPGKSIVDLLRAGSVGRSSAASPLRRVDEICLHPGGRTVAVHGPPDRHKAFVVDLETGAVRREVSHPRIPGQQIEGLAWHPDGEILATACQPNEIHIWDSQSGEEKMVLEGQGTIVEIAFSPDGRLLASTGWDTVLRLWDTGSGRQWVAGRGSYGALFGPGDADDSAQLLGSLSTNSQIWVWKLDRARELRVLRDGLYLAADAYERITDLDFSRDGRWLATSDQRGHLKLWDLAVSKRRPVVARGTTAALKCVSIENDVAGILTWGTKGLERFPVDFERDADGVSRPVIGPPEFLGVRPESRFGLAARSGDGRTLFVANDYDRGRGVVVDLETREPRATLEGRPGLFFVALNADASLAAGGTYKGKGVRVWNLPGGDVAANLPAEQSSEVAFSPGGSLLITAEPDAYRAWKVSSWELAWSHARENFGRLPGTVTFAGDGSTLAVLHTLQDVLLLDPRTGSVQAALTSPDPSALPQLRLDFHGRRLAASTTDGSIELWDLERIRRQLREIGLE